MARILATFRIEENDWNAFKRITDSKGTNASQEIVRFIKSCIDGSDLSILDIVKTSNLDERIAEYLDNNLEASIDKSIDRVIDNHLDKKLDKHLDDYVNINQLDNRARSIIERFDPEINQLRDRINQLESQLGEKNSTQNTPKTSRTTKKIQTQAKEPSKPEIANIEDINLEDGLTVSQVAERLSVKGLPAVTPKAVEGYRNRKTLEERGYTAKKINDKWRYFPINLASLDPVGMTETPTNMEISESPT